jgi:hypothetical protein
VKKDNRKKEKKALDNNPLISYIGYMKEKIITISSKNITPKQWSVLLLELNILKKAWSTLC